MAMKTAAGGNGRGEQFKFDEEGTTLEGYFLGSNEITINDKQVLAHSVKTADGSVYSPLGSTDLNSKMEEVPVGARVVIAFTGTKKIKGRPVPMKIFSVQYDDQDCAPLTTAQKAAEALASASLK